MTTSFYAPLSAFRDGYVTLPEDEARHAIRVVRKKAGDEIVVVDGEGGWHRVRLEHVDKRNAAGRVVDTQHDVGEPSYRLSIGLAVLKNRNRFETFLEKAVELGVSEIVPLLTHRTEKQNIKQQRARNILIAAMKQTGRSRLVHLAEPQPLENALAQADATSRYLCHEQIDGSEHHLARMLAQQGASDTVQVLVGPEGGFTPEEVEAARQARFVPVTLGARRLRAETAALVAATAVMLARP